MKKSAFLLIALFVGTIVTVVANQILTANTGGEADQQVAEIFVASVAIDIGEEITPEKVRLEQWPIDKIPEGSTGDFEGLEEKYAKQRFYTGEPIMPLKLMDDNWTTVPKNFSVVAMKASDVSIANLIQPGDRVDVLAFFEKSELVPQSMLKTVLMGVRVYALDGDTERRAGDDRPKRIQNIQLLIHKKDQQAWAYAGELGKIQLALGSDADYSTEDGSNQAAAEFLGWLDDYREAQQQAANQAKRDKDASRNRSRVTMMPKPKEEKKEEEDGFSMIKMVEGRMVEYWIVPGKLPVKIGEVGGDDTGSMNSSSTDSSTSRSQPRDTKDEGEYSYLNGEDSPLFQPPPERSGSINEQPRQSSY
ncbi:Flp pilus assembly protein CpaB [Rubripirellula amarantea]|uniref:SAF domain-containing protein n=1 Tax=Rubripirellula amarantea TaxID=2527999 RepID=A0A5C5WW12_9BACT|nr:Flp pilus assembly protein CpaB [Rubripirellula amarantea]MDA8745588.1 Flp pilus assembly protein CpaB [Rubripirellula amarantea]TWT54125.1 hypothetical protein Pla22_17600 [Rubripirellula amarantea]